MFFPLTDVLSKLCLIFEVKKTKKFKVGAKDQRKASNTHQLSVNGSKARELNEELLEGSKEGWRTGLTLHRYKK
jgi:hypothetical protein